jgi:hypothetical protein
VEVFATPAPSLPCSWDVDTECCSTFWDTLSPELQQSAAEYGALTVWAATGRRFGLCTRTVRPCGRWCATPGVYGYFWSDGTFMPYIFNGVWRNCWCGCTGSSGCCSCEPRCQVLLDGPVAAIPATGVSQDGEIVPVDAWRVDDGMWLVRTDGECWPECQDYNLDSGVGTFFVTYQQGIPVPSVLARAAGELACEWAKGCMDQPCRLPSRLQSLTRQGVSISTVSLDDLLHRGLTGVATVDSVISSFNPYGLRSAMRISSPDLPVTRQTTIP